MGLRDDLNAAVQRAYMLGNANRELQEKLNKANDLIAAFRAGANAVDAQDSNLCAMREALEIGDSATWADCIIGAQDYREKCSNLEASLNEHQSNLEAALCQPRRKYSMEELISQVDDLDVDKKDLERKVEDLPEDWQDQLDRLADAEATLDAIREALGLTAMDWDRALHLRKLPTGQELLLD